MSKYMCRFVLDYNEMETFVPSIADIKEGFWVNGVKEFTKKEDCKYWIPPSQIMYVEKIEGH